MPIAKLIEVESSQVHAIGHDPETQTLAVHFKHWKGEFVSVYHYANVTADDFAAFLAAESKGRHFGQHIKPFADKYPFTKIESAPAPSAE